MTGFSSVTIELPVHDATVSATINLKSLNSRFFEINCKLPYALAQLEADTIKTLKKQLRRGSVNCSVYCPQQSLLKGALQPANHVVRDYIDAARSIQEQFNVPGNLSIQDIITLPSVFESQEITLEKETVAALQDGIQQAIERLITERRKEGKQLQNDLEERIAFVTDVIGKLEERSETVMDERKTKLLENMESFIGTEASEAKEHQMQIIYSQLEKIDIHEEIVRFKAHLLNITESIQAETTEKGKKIDFILQELFRETNTITAKSDDAQLSSYGINIKVELEKAREQAQNIV
jgi:uncharacterized protein (TIGR00255 family)